MKIGPFWRGFLSTFGLCSPKLPTRNQRHISYLEYTTKHGKGQHIVSNRNPQARKSLEGMHDIHGGPSLYGYLDEYTSRTDLSEQSYKYKRPS